MFLDYSKGFGGKYGVEKEKVDKAALGYDYKGETEKHQSQKGVFRLEGLSVSTLLASHFIYFASYSHQTMQRDSEESTGWRRKRWTKRLWGTTIKEKQRNTSRRKVIQSCSIPQICLLFARHLIAVFCTLIQITLRDSEESTGWRRRKWTKLLWATIIKARRRNISHKKVRKHSTCVSIKIWEGSKEVRLIRFLSV